MDKSFLQALAAETNNEGSLNLSPDTHDELQFALTLREINYLESCDHQIAYEHLLERAAKQNQLAQQSLENARESRQGNDEATAREYDTDASEAKRREKEYRRAAEIHRQALVKSQRKNTAL